MFHKSFFHTAVSVALLTTVACGSKDEAAVPPAAANPPAAQQVPPRPAPGTAVPAAPAAPSADELPPPVEPESAAALRTAMQAMMASNEGNTSCEKSFNAINAMIGALQKSGQSQHARPAPNRADYLRLCEDLPEDAQLCTIPSHAMQNGQACQQIMERPEVAAKLQAMQNELTSEDDAPTPARRAHD